jgi:hypothetical protein
MGQNKCAKCGAVATRKLEIESEVGSVWLCDSNDCRKTLIEELRLMDFPNNFQGRRSSQVEYAERVGAMSTVIIIAVTIGYVVYSLFR